MYGDDDLGEDEVDLEDEVEDEDEVKDEDKVDA